MRITILLFLLYTCTLLHAQEDEANQHLREALSRGSVLPQELKDSLQGKDFSTLWTITPNSQVYGFIGDDYQRLRVKLLSVIKDVADPTVYRVYGKDMVKTNVCEFQGEFKIATIRQYYDISYGVDHAYRDSSIQGRFVVCGTYRLLENPEQRHVGLLTGSFASYFYIDRTGSVRWDNIEAGMDSYCNNQFVGTWTSYDGRQTKRCNWGDERIPGSGKLDIGAGIFSPDDKYLPFGWQTYRDAYFGSAPNEKASAIESADWWK